MLLVVFINSLCQGIAYAGELSDDLALFDELYTQQNDSVDALPPVDPFAMPISGIFDDVNDEYYIHLLQAEPVKTEVTPPQKYQLTPEKIHALCATRKGRRWENDGVLLAHEARKLRVTQSVMHNAVLEMIRRGSLAQRYLAKKDVLRLSAAYERYNDFHANCRCLKRLGLTRQTYAQMAQKLGVSPEDLNAYRVHLLHKCGRLDRDTVDITKAAVVRFMTKKHAPAT